jgi:hypothetical protein
MPKRQSQPADLLWPPSLIERVNRSQKKGPFRTVPPHRRISHLLPSASMPPSEPLAACDYFSMASSACPKGPDYGSVGKWVRRRSSRLRHPGARFPRPGRAAVTKRCQVRVIGVPRSLPRSGRHLQKCQSPAAGRARCGGCERCAAQQRSVITGLTCLGLPITPPPIVGPLSERGIDHLPCL